jgi:microcompartment protein CcmL/EutN
VKGARVTLRDLRLADDLGGKGYVLFGGEVAEVEAAVDHGVERAGASGQVVMNVVISQLHAGMRDNLTADSRFGERTRDLEKHETGTGRTPRSVVELRGRPLPGSGAGSRN